MLDHFSTVGYAEVIEPPDRVVLAEIVNSRA
jgi:hypothetical protein